MRSALATAVAAAVVLLLQTTLFPPLRAVIAVTPDLVLVLAVYLGLRHPTALGACGAFLLGYCLDTFAGNTLGLHAFTLTRVFAGTALVSGAVRTDSGGTLVLVVFAAGCLEAAAVTTVLALGGSEAAPWRPVLRYGVGQAALAALLAPLVLRLVWVGERVRDDV